MPSLRQIHLLFAAAFLLFAQNTLAADEPSERDKWDSRLNGLFDVIEHNEKADVQRLMNDFRISASEYARLDEALGSSWSAESYWFTDVDTNVEAEVKAQVFGFYLLGHSSDGCHCFKEKSWREYCRYLRDARPRVRAIAMTYLSVAFCTSSDSALFEPALAGCRDDSPIVRTAAFRLLSGLIRWDPTDPHRQIAREFVLAAFCGDRKVDKRSLYQCAKVFGHEMREIRDIIFQGMHDPVQGTAAAECLAIVDSRTEMIRQVVGEFRETKDEAFKDSALTYFAKLPGDAAPNCRELIALLKDLLRADDSETRLRAATISLASEYATLHSQAITCAENLLYQDEFLSVHTGQIVERIVEFGTKTPEARELVMAMVRNKRPEDKFGKPYYADLVDIWRAHFHHPEKIKLARELLDELERRPELEQD